MAGKKPKADRNPRKIAGAVAGRQHAEDDLDRGQSRIDRSEETQDAVDKYFNDDSKQ